MTDVFKYVYDEAVLGFTIRKISTVKNGGGEDLYVWRTGDIRTSLPIAVSPCGRAWIWKRVALRVSVYVHTATYARISDCIAMIFASIFEPWFSSPFPETYHHFRTQQESASADNSGGRGPRESKKSKWPLLSSNIAATGWSTMEIRTIEGIRKKNNF